MQAKRESSVGNAISAKYDSDRERIVVELDSGIEFSFPVTSIERMVGANAEQLSDVKISGGGQGLHWPLLDEDLFIPELLHGNFGRNRWMAQLLGANGGRARTSAKKAASRENGKLGGRPRKHASAGNA